MHSGEGIIEYVNMSSERKEPEEWVIGPIPLPGAPADIEEGDEELKMAQLISFLASILQNICKVIFEALVQ